MQRYKNSAKSFCVAAKNGINMRILTKMSCSYSDNRLISPDNASPHAMKDATGVFHLIDFAFMSAEHDVSAKPLSRKVPTKRHPVAYKLSRWDASDSHLISLTLLHVHSSRRALAHSINLHFPSLPPYYNIQVFLFISILSFLINLSVFLLYNLRPRHSPVSMNS